MSHTCDNLTWLGIVPAHWKVLKLRQILSSISDKNHTDFPLLSVVRKKVSALTSGICKWIR